MADTTSILGLPYPELADGPPDVAGDIQLLAEAVETLGAFSKIAALNPTAGVITFSSIPATYAHLRIVGSVRGDNAGGAMTLRLRFNGASAAVYYSRVHQSESTGGSTGIDGEGITTTVDTAGTSGSLGDVASEFESEIGTSGMQGITIDIPNYANAFWKTWIFNASRPSVTGAGGPGQQNVDGSGHWRNTAAVTSVSLLTSTGTLEAGSLVSLYGLR